MLLRTVVGIVCLSVLLPCQNPETGEEVRTEDVRTRSKEEGRGEKSDPDESLTPEQRLEKHIIHGATQHCRFLTSVKPAKLMPGQTGTLMIVATLQGSAVLPAPCQLTVLPNPVQGAVTVGDLTVKPAEAGRLAKAYLGRPVYDNYAEMSVPVSMSPTAEVGKKHVVSVDVKFDLYDGNSAQVIGRFVDRIATEIEVGTVPDPAVLMGHRPAANAGAPAAAGAAPADAGNSPAPAPESPKSALQGNAVVPPAATSEAAPQPAAAGDVAALPAPAAEGGSTMPLIAGAGVVALILVLLLARKK